MQDDTIKILRLSQEDAKDAARVHTETLPGDMAARLGEDFLRDVFYPELLASSGASGWKAVSNGRLCGFIVFRGDQNFFRRLLRGRLWLFLRLASARLHSPSFLKYALEVLWLLSRNPAPQESGPELAYIAMEKKHQGAGAGSKLARRGLDFLRESGAKTCWVKTLENTTENVAFYEKLGFSAHDRRLGRVFLSIRL